MFALVRGGLASLEGVLTIYFVHSFDLVAKRRLLEEIVIKLIQTRGCS
jgi:hypothetical protein